MGATCLEQCPPWGTLGVTYSRLSAPETGLARGCLSLLLGLSDERMILRGKGD